MPAGIGPREAEALAAHVTGARPAFAAAFDAVRLGGADFKLLAAGAPDCPAAHARAFRAADAGGFLGMLLGRLTALMLLDMAGALAALGALPGAQDRTARIAPFLPAELPPAIADPVTGALMSEGLTRALRRVCKVRVGEDSGTGFLIGPQTVLTNWHVARTAIDAATGRARDGSAREITCLFDNLDGGSGRTCRATEDWLAGFNPLDAASAREQGYEDLSAHHPAPWLDFCAIRLAGVPGRKRGWYDLATPGGLDHATDLTYVVQHAQGDVQQVAVGQGSTVDANILQHNALTAGGSSGALCLDHRYRVLALHSGREGKGASSRGRAILARPFPRPSASGASAGAT